MFQTGLVSIFLAETKGNINQAGCTTNNIGIFYKVYFVYTKTDEKVTIKRCYTVEAILVQDPAYRNNFESR